MREDESNTKQYHHLFQSAIESLFGASMTGVAYSLFAGQPLTILGSTGPVLVFEKILFKFCKYVQKLNNSFAD